MTLDLSAPRVFKRTVRVQRPAGDGMEEESFSATFRLLDADEFSGHDLREGEGARAVLAKAIVSLDDIADESGPLSYSEALRDRVLQVPYLSAALIYAYFLGADEIDMTKLGSAFVVYQGTHGDAGAHRADVILPGAAYTEKPATWVNTEGRVQLGRRAVFPPGQAREDWTILRALSGVIGKVLPYDNLDALRAAMAADAPHFAEADMAVSAGALPDLARGELDAAPFESPVKDFYMSNPVARASAVMAECAAGRVAAARIQAAE